MCGAKHHLGAAGAGILEKAVKDTLSYSRKVPKKLDPPKPRPKPNAVQVGDVGYYRDFTRRSQVGDAIDGDHIPSTAAVIRSFEARNMRRAKPSERRLLKQDATTVAVPDSVHAQSRTYIGDAIPKPD